LPASRRFSLEQPRATRIDARKGLELFQLSDHLPLAKEVLQEVHARPHDELYTSALTVGEILIKPVEAGDEALVRRYESALLQGAVILPFDVEPARLYATIRKDRTIRPLDAIQLACASHARVDLFITNDERLSTKTIPRIQFVSSLQRTFL
jgi:predicted nucleic acid-binding protein